MTSSITLQITLATITIHFGKAPTTASESISADMTTMLRALDYDVNVDEDGDLILSTDFMPGRSSKEEDRMKWARTTVHLRPFFDKNMTDEEGERIVKPLSMETIQPEDPKKWKTYFYKNIVGSELIAHVEKDIDRHCANI